MENNENLYVAGIGASAGGLDAIKQFFDNVPPTTGMAFVVIQHLSPDFKSLMLELLAKHTKMKIYKVEDGQKIEPNCIYLNQRNKDLITKAGKFVLLENKRKTGVHLPIDIFFHSLGEEFKEHAIGIVLSGTGSDSSRGIKTIKEAGGTIIVQEPSTAQFNGMPNSAIATNLADYIASPTDIYEILAKIKDHPVIFTEYNNIPETDEAIFNKILEEVHKCEGIDFLHYKKKTLLRRVEKRLNFNNLTKLQDYLDLIKEDNKEIEILKRDLLIQVTSFFRDEEAYSILRDQIIPDIVKQKKENDLIRIWIAGCSTGEEAYSIAICFDEYLKKQGVNINFKIFASDVDQQVLRNAANGIFAANAMSEIGEKYLEKYFIKTGERIEIVKHIREKIVFSPHNLMQDPPFIKMDLISCRNVLIYFDGASQENILSNFQYSLNLNGYLFLGSSESLGGINQHFEVINRKWKFFKNINESRHLPVGKSLQPIYKADPYSKQLSTLKYSQRNIAPSKESPDTKYHRILGEKYSPDCILYDKDYNILFIKGEAGQKLIMKGVFQNNLLSMVNKDVANLIRSTTKKLDKSDNDILIENIPFSDSNSQKPISLLFSKIPDSQNPKNDTYSIIFKNTELEIEVVKIKNLDINEISTQRIEYLELELKSNKFELQNVVEELETSNEELMASNEELMASNEELQSANEELQSVNEELHTVNSELQEKNKELENLNNDINNLLNSTDIGTLFLDSDLRIRKFTPSLRKHFNLTEDDIMRPISNFASNFDEETRMSIINYSKKSLTELKTFEQEIKDDQDNFFLKRVSPFITSNKQIEGVVITFVNISTLKEQRKMLIKSETRYKSLFDAMTEGFIRGKVVKNYNGKLTDFQLIDMNEAFASQAKFDKENIEECVISKLVSNETELNKWLNRFLEIDDNGKNQTFSDYIPFLNGYYTVHIFSTNKDEIAATFVDLTQMKHVEQSLRLSNQQFELASEITGLALWEWNIPEDTATGNRHWNDMFSFDKGNIAKQWKDNMHKDDVENTLKLLKNHLDGESDKFQCEFRYKNPTTKITYWLKSIAKVIEKDSKNKPLKMLGISLNITQQKNGFVKLEKEKLFNQKLSEATPNGVYVFNLNCKRYEYINSHYTKILGYNIDELNALSYKEHLEKIHDNDREQFETHFNKMMAEKELFSLEYRVKNKSGKWVWCLSFISPFQVDRKGKLLTYVGVILDITSRKAMEKQVLAEKKKSEIANHHKNLFLANVSHEIRTPMNHVIGFSQLLRREDITVEEREKYLNIIDSSSNHLIKLIDDIIDISKIEAGELKVSFEESNIRKLFSEVKSTYDQLIKDKEKDTVSLSLQCPSENDEELIIIDLQRVNQILVNLLNNAIKFTENGKIVFGYKFENSFLHFFVLDEGIGISKHDIKNLFRSFSQVSHDPSRFGGTGLGLAICKGLAQLMKGEINVESEVGKGSKFSVSIPYEKPQIKPKREPLQSKVQNHSFFIGKTILMAEDDDFIQLHIKELLKDTGANLIFAANGKSAVDKFKSNTNIDLILMDIRMPIMNGYDAIKEILKIDKNAVIVMLTAYAMQDEKEKCFKLGCKDYLTKPINLKELEFTLEKWLS